MTESLLHAYLPLFIWAGLGWLLFQFVPDHLPRLLGRSLYWVGVPVEIFALARQTHWSHELRLAPLLTLGAILLGLVLAGVALQGILRWISASISAASIPAAPIPAVPTSRAISPSPLPASEVTTPTASQPVSLTTLPLATLPLATDLPLAETKLAYHWKDRARQGSFILSSMLGNTGFVGLAIAPTFVNSSYLGWLVLYSVTQNVVGTYGIGVFLASYYGRPSETNHWWLQVRDVVGAPSLWGFILGCLSQAIAFPAAVEQGIQSSVWVVIPAALLLMGMRLSQLRGWQSLQLGIVPSLIKAVAIPVLIGVLATYLKLAAEARLALVLMAGMPTAFAGLILAEEYELDRELIASSIVLTSGLLMVTIPLWLFLFS